MSDLDVSFRMLLNQVLKEQDISIVQAAEICGIPQANFLCLVHGPATTTLPEASRILRRLGVEGRVVRFNRPVRRPPPQQD